MNRRFKFSRLSFFDFVLIFGKQSIQPPDKVVTFSQNICTYNSSEPPDRVVTLQIKIYKKHSSAWLKFELSKSLTLRPQSTNMLIRLQETNR